MTTHPISEWHAQAEAHADTVSDVEWLWWQDYRHIYAQLAGVYDEPPQMPDQSLMAYLTSLDDQIRELRSEAR